jgi:excisionase family DNA binding protein
MQTINPFELILSRLDQLQSTVNVLTDKATTPNAGPAVNPDRLVDLSEAAEILRKPVGTVRYYIHHRSLPATKVGKSYLVKVAELLQWFEQFSQKAAGKKGAVDRMIQQRNKYKKP